MYNESSKPFNRPLSLIERSHLVFDALSPPLINQMVFEGRGELDLVQWRSAVDEASAANPGSRMVLRGCLGTCRWVDTGLTPPVREVDGNSWSGLSRDGAPILQERLFPSTGPTCEVILMHGDPARVVFRSHHGVMDGRGTMTWAEDVFRSLRGDPIIGSASTLTEDKLAQNFENEYRTSFPRDCLAPTGESRGTEFSMVWLRRRIEGSYQNLLAQAAIMMAREARLHENGNVWFLIPIDVRSRKPGLRSTNNMSLSIYIEVKPDVKPNRLMADMARKIHQKQDVMTDKWDHLFKLIPLWMLRVGARMETKYRMKKGRYSHSGIITYFSNVDLEPYTCNEFYPDKVFFIPPNIIGSPSFMVLTESGGGVDLTLSMPSILANGGRLESAMDRIVEGLMSDN